MLTPEQYKENSANLVELVNRQIDITKGSDIDDARAEAKPSDELDDIKNRLDTGSLNVLVMGKFSGGKSTFLNALMGKKLLPAKPKPTTAIIGEIQYAEEPSATLYPKEKFEEEPFDISADDMEKYVVIDNDESQEDVEKEENHYSKIVVKYPLSICKMGINLVDSPGLDDPSCHDAITLDYLPTADAIIYCMNSQQAFSAMDKAEIESLRALGYTSMIFVLTYFDLLEHNDMLQGTNEAETTRQYYIELLTPYTDLGSDGIFFVGSLPALMGKIKNNPEMVKSSHMPEVEKKLENILFNERGRIKLIKALYSVKKINRATGHYLTDTIDLLRQDKTTLASKLSEAQNNLNKAKDKADLISNNFTNSAKELIDGVRIRTQAFFTADILPNIEKWTMQFAPAEGQDIKIFKPKSTGKIFAEACVKYIQKRIETAVSEWCQNDLVPNFVVPRLEYIANEQNANLKAYEEDLNNVRGDLSLSIVANGPEISNANRIISSIFGVLGGPAAIAVGGSMGWRGLVPALVSQMVAGVILGIIAYFNPVSFPVAIIVTVLAGLFGGFVGTMNMCEKVTKEIGKKTKEEMKKNQDAFVTNIVNGINGVVEKACKAVKEDLYIPVNEYQKLLENAQKDISTEGKVIEAKISHKTLLKKDNEVLAEDMEDFGQQLNIIV